MGKGIPVELSPETQVALTANVGCIHKWSEPSGSGSFLNYLHILCGVYQPVAELITLEDVAKREELYICSKCWWPGESSQLFKFLHSLGWRP